MKQESAHFRAFAWLLAAATLVHFWNQVELSSGLFGSNPNAPMFHPSKLLSWELTLGNIVGCLVIAIGLCVLAKPREQSLYTHLVCVVVFSSATYPFVPDHLLLETYIAIAVLIGAALHRFKKREGDPLPTFIGAARWVYLMCYGASALAKYNWHFVDPEQSCVGFLNKGLGQTMLAAPDTPFGVWPVLR